MRNLLLTLSILLPVISAGAGQTLRGGIEHEQDPALCTPPECRTEVQEFPFYNRMITNMTNNFGSYGSFHGISTFYLGTHPDGDVGWIVHCDHCGSPAIIPGFTYTLPDGTEMTPLAFPLGGIFEVSGVTCIFGNCGQSVDGDWYIPVQAKPGHSLPSPDVMPILEQPPMAAFFGGEVFTVALSIGNPTWSDHDTLGWFEECTSAQNGIGGCVADRDSDDYDPLTVRVSNRTTPGSNYKYLPKLRGNDATESENGEVCSVPGAPSNGDTQGGTVYGTGYPGTACFGGEGTRNAAITAGRKYLGPTYIGRVATATWDAPVPLYWALEHPENISLNYTPRMYSSPLAGNMGAEPQQGSYEAISISWYPDITNVCNLVLAMDESLFPQMVEVLQYPDVASGDCDHYRYQIVHLEWKNGAEPIPVSTPAITDPNWTIFDSAENNMELPMLCPTQNGGPTGAIGCSGNIQPYHEMFQHGDSGSHTFVYWQGQWWWAGGGQVPQEAHILPRYSDDWYKLNGIIDRTGDWAIAPDYSQPLPSSF